MIHCENSVSELFVPNSLKPLYNFVSLNNTIKFKFQILSFFNSLILKPANMAVYVTKPMTGTTRLHSFAA